MALELDNDDPYIKRFLYDGAGNVQYIGKAAPGTLTSEAKWSITRLTYNGVPAVTAKDFAGSSNEFKSIFDNAASLVYG